MPSKRKDREHGTAASAAPPSEPKTSQQDKILSLLRRQQGASIEEMTQATGWLPHSVRGWMSGAARNRLGLEFVSERVRTVCAAITSRR